LLRFGVSRKAQKYKFLGLFRDKEQKTGSFEIIVNNYLGFAFFKLVLCFKDGTTF